jgi:hypothetical protein
MKTAARRPTRDGSNACAEGYGIGRPGGKEGAHEATARTSRPAEPRLLSYEERRFQGGR